MRRPAGLPKWLWITTLVLAVAPLWSVAIQAALWLLACAILGRPPVVYRDDPAETLGIAYDVGMFAWLILVAASVGVPLLAPLWCVSWGWRRGVLIVIVALAVWGVALGLSHVDAAPDIGVWLMD